MTPSIAVQSVQDLGGAGSVLTRQRREHVALDGLLQRLRATSGVDQDEVITQIRRLVFPHAFAEESVLWPAARRALPDGEELTLRIEREHQRVNELVTRLDRSRPGDPDRAQLLDEVVEVLQQDVRDEEDLLLPRLQQALDPPALRRLGLAWELVRRLAPTHAHPVVARRPPGNVLAGLPLTLIDRTRDRLDRAVRRGGGPAATLGRAVSRALAGLAGLVERLPPLRVGEDPSTARR